MTQIWGYDSSELLPQIHVTYSQTKSSGLNIFFQNRLLFRLSAGTAKFSEIYLPFTILDWHIQTFVHKYVTYILGDNYFVSKCIWYLILGDTYLKLYQYEMYVP